MSCTLISPLSPTLSLRERECLSCVLKMRDITRACLTTIPLCRAEHRSGGRSSPIGWRAGRAPFCSRARDGPSAEPDRSEKRRREAAWGRPFFASLSLAAQRKRLVARGRNPASNQVVALNSALSTLRLSQQKIPSTYEGLHRRYLHFDPFFMNHFQRTTQRLDPFRCVTLNVHDVDRLVGAAGDIRFEVEDV